MPREGECAYCGTTIKFIGYPVYGEQVCSATCGSKYERDVARYQLVLRLQPITADEEADRCNCVKCYDDG